MNVVEDMRWALASIKDVGLTQSLQEADSLLASGTFSELQFHVSRYQLFSRVGQEDAAVVELDAYLALGGRDTRIIYAAAELFESHLRDDDCVRCCDRVLADTDAGYFFNETLLVKAFALVRLERTDEAKAALTMMSDDAVTVWWLKDVPPLSKAIVLNEASARARSRA